MKAVALLLGLALAVDEGWGIAIPLEESSGADSHANQINALGELLLAMATPARRQMLTRRVSQPTAQGTLDTEPFIGEDGKLKLPRDPFPGDPIPWMVGNHELSEREDENFWVSELTFHKDGTLTVGQTRGIDLPKGSHGVWQSGGDDFQMVIQRKFPMRQFEPEWGTYSVTRHYVGYLGGTGKRPHFQGTIGFYDEDMHQGGLGSWVLRPEFAEDFTAEELKERGLKIPKSKKTMEDPSEWDIEQVVDYITQLGLGKYAGAFREFGIHGQQLVKMSAFSLSNELGLNEEQVNLLMGDLEGMSKSAGFAYEKVEGGEASLRDLIKDLKTKGLDALEPEELEILEGLMKNEQEAMEQ
jgi:hypothetical protein